MKIVNFIGDDRKRFDELFQLFLSDEYRVVQRASWVVNCCVESHPCLVKPYFPELIKILENPHHNAVKRNILRMLQYVDIPEKWQGAFYEIALNFCLSSKEPAAVRVFSMQVLCNIAKDIPELKEELIELLSSNQEAEQPSIKARIKRILKILNK